LIPHRAPKKKSAKAFTANYYSAEYSLLILHFFFFLSVARLKGGVHRITVDGLFTFSDYEKLREHAERFMALMAAYGGTVLRKRKNPRKFWFCCFVAEKIRENLG
jgi:hypothetical protein